MDSVTKKQRKNFKRFAKKLLSIECPERDPRILIERVKGEYDETRYQFLVNASTEGEVRDILEDFIPLDGLDAVPSAYDCTGQRFCDPAVIRQVAEKRFYIAQCIHYDL